MFDLVRAFGPLLLALAVSAAVAAAALLVIRSVQGGANRAIIAAMPKYAPRGGVRHPAAGAWQGASPVTMAESNQSPFLRLGQLLTTAKYRNWMQLKLADAGLRGPIALRAQLVKKVTYAVVGAMLGISLLTRWADGGMVLVVVLIAIGFFLPDLLLVSEGQKRVEATERALPDAIDLLNLCVESGLSFENAMGRVSVSLDGPVAEEFGALIADLQLGKSRVDGLAALAERTKSKGLKQFASALLQVDRLGVPISGVLHEQATDMRAVRKDRAREQGQKVTIKILMPLMFCFLPAMFMIVLGPAIVQLVKTMSLL